MTTIIRFSIIIFLIFTGSSCRKDFLNSVNDGSILLRQEYVVDINTTGEYLNGVYAMMGQELFVAYNYVYPELIADNIQPVQGASGTTPMIFQYNWQQQENNLQSGITATSINCNGLSYTCYRLIRACNFTIECTDKFKNENPEKAAMLKGQALSIRAYANHLLLNVFAQPYNFTVDASHPGIVLVTSSNFTEIVAARSTVAECYVKIIEDLKQAIDLLNSAPPSTLIFNRNATIALLARVYLWKGDYQQARIYSLEAIEAVPLMISGYPDKLFTPGETEAIFQLLPADVSINNYMTLFASYNFRDNIEFRATSDIALLLSEDTNDKRGAWVSHTDAGWNITKFPKGVIPGIATLSASYCQTVIRSSEMYLTASEAYAKLNRTDSAIFFLDAIRVRANAEATNTIASGDQLLELIYKERRKELAFESLRMFDLLRWGKGVERQGVLNGSPQTLSYPNNRSIAPVPGLDVHSSGIKQNTDY